LTSTIRLGRMYWRTPGLLSGIPVLARSNRDFNPHQTHVYPSSGPGFLTGPKDREA
jgi:hypothetical protein